MQTQNPTRALLALALALTVGALAAAGPAAAITPEKWKADYANLEQMLRSGRWQEAEAGISRLFKETMEQYGPTGQMDGSLVQLTAMRAIAEQGLGRAAEATWHWQTAVALLPDLQRADLSAYGEPAKVLQAMAPRARALPAGEAYRHDGPVGEVADLQGPKKSKSPGIRVPSLRMKDMGGLYTFEVIVGADGAVGAPLLIERRGPASLALLAFDALHGWRFKPATRAGQPVAVPYLVRLGTGGLGRGDLEEPELPDQPQ